MSSNLPPGVTDADIERAFGDRPSLLEAFETYLNHEGISAADAEKLDIIYNQLFDLPGSIEKVGAIEDYLLAEFVERAMTWAYEQGQKDEGDAYGEMQVRAWQEDELRKLGVSEEDITRVLGGGS